MHACSSSPSPSLPFLTYLGCTTININLFLHHPPLTYHIFTTYIIPNPLIVPHIPSKTHLIIF